MDSSIYMYLIYLLKEIKVEPNEMIKKQKNELFDFLLKEQLKKINQRLGKNNAKKQSYII